MSRIFLEKAFAAAVVLAIGVHVSSGRLGDTLDECNARYGSFISRGSYGERYIFSHNYLTITVEFRNGHSVSEEFKPQPGQALSEELVADILASNSAGERWSVVNETTAVRRYARIGAEAEYRFAPLARQELTISAVGSAASPEKTPSGNF